MRSYWIWFVGATVWWVVAALYLYYGPVLHGWLAAVVAVLFLAAGMVYRRQALRKP